VTCSPPPLTFDSLITVLAKRCSDKVGLFYGVQTHAGELFEIGGEIMDERACEMEV
jgi:hypothetical protein